MNTIIKQTPSDNAPDACCTLEISGNDQQRLVTMFDGLSNPARFEIMKFLVTHNGCHTQRIVESVPLAQATVSQHLKVLEESGWVERSAEGAATSVCQHEENIEWFRTQIGNIF